MKIKNKKHFLIILAMIIIAVMATTYAYMQSEIIGNESDKITVTVEEFGIIKVTYDSTYSQINIPELDLNGTTAGDTLSYMMKFNITNIGEKTIDVAMRWDDIVNNFCQYRDENYECVDPDASEYYVGDELRSSVYECNESDYALTSISTIKTECTKISSNNDAALPVTGSTNILNTSPITVPKDTIKYYVLIVDIDNLVTNQNYQQSRSAVLGIKIDFFEVRNLTNAINSAYTVQTDASVDFGISSSSSGTKGLYTNNKVNVVSDSTQGLIKYFRGNVDNYIEFGTYKTTTYHPTTGEGIKEQYPSLDACNDQYPSGNCALYHNAGNAIMWRVMRMDNTNKVRLITEDTIIPKSGFNATSAEARYVGYTWDNDSIPSLSDIKIALDSWYTGNLNDVTAYINQEAMYCNDASGSINGFGPYLRLDVAKTPTFNCTTPLSTYGGSYEFPIATISADEISYAGGVLDSNNSTYYLNNATNYWTMSPSNASSNAFLFYVSNTGLINEVIATDTAPGYRAVIELNANAQVSGLGTVDSPWVVQ